MTGPAEDPARYEVSDENLDLAQIGGEGLVYRARHCGTDRIVALKLLSAVPMADFDQVRQRADLLSGVAHPHLMLQLESFVGTALHDDRHTGDDVGLGEEGELGMLYSVAEWIEGSPLDRVVDSASPYQRGLWIAELADALSVFHRSRPDAPEGMVHRDVKPSNVRIRTDGAAVLVDFGVARAAEPIDVTQGVGTYRWRAPEVLAGTAAANRPAVDVWGLGAVAHWCFTGDPPLLDGAGAARERLLASPDIARFRDPGAVADHLSALLASRPEDRPTDLVLWASQLRRIASRRSNRSRQLRWARTALLAALVIGAASLAVVAVVSLVVPPTDDADATTTSVTSPEAATAMTCTSDAAIPLLTEPPLTHTARRTTFRLAGDAPTFSCPEPRGTTATFESFDIVFDSLSCDAPRATAEVDRTKIVWGDGTEANVDIVAHNDSLMHGRLDLRISSGIEQTRGTVEFSVISVDEGSCDDGGVRRQTIRLDELRVLPD